MAPPEKGNNHEIPDLAMLESENIIVRKKRKSAKNRSSQNLSMRTKNGSRNVKDDAKGRLPEQAQICRNESPAGTRKIKPVYANHLFQSGNRGIRSVPALNEGRIAPLRVQEKRAVIP